MLKLKVKEIAESQGHTMTSLARATGISFNTIKRLWRHPYEGANVQTLAKIAKVLEVTINDLTEEEPDTNR